MNRLRSEWEDAPAAKLLPGDLERYHEKMNTGRHCNSYGPLTLTLVLEHAGPVLLELPGHVRRWLCDADLQRLAAKALANLGPASAPFLPDLLQQPKVDAAAIAAIVSDDRATVEHLRDAVLRGESASSRRDQRALELLGARAAQLVPTLADDLLGASQEPDRLELLFAAAAIAPDRRDIFQRVLAVAADTTTCLRPHPHFPDQAWDENLWKRGAAITALAHFRSFAPEAIPTLVATLDNFEEYDPDETYELGDHGRTVTALRKLLNFPQDDSAPPPLTRETAAAFAPHVPRLIAHLVDTSQQPDFNMIQFVGQLGQVAAPALPALRALDTSLGSDDPAPFEKPVRLAIRRIRSP